MANDDKQQRNKLLAQVRLKGFSDPKACRLPSAQFQQRVAGDQIYAALRLNQDLDSFWVCLTLSWPRIDWRPMKSLCQLVSTARSEFSFISLRKRMEGPEAIKAWTSSRETGPQSMEQRISSSSWVMTLLISRNWFSSSWPNFLLRAMLMKV